MLRALAFAGPAIEAVAIVQQLRWHADHPNTEPFGSVLVAHGGIYLGIALGALGAAAWLRDARRERAAAVVLAAAFLRLLAVAFDAFAHRDGLDLRAGHDLYRAGLWLGAAGLALGIVIEARRWRRASLAAREGDGRDPERDDDAEHARAG